MKNKSFYPFLCVLLLFLFNINSFALDFPKTEAGKRAKQLFAVMNKEVDTPPKDFVRLNCSNGFKNSVPESAWGGAIQQVSAMSGKMELDSIVVSNPFDIEFLVRSISTGMHFQISLAVEQNSPYLISSVAIQPAGMGNPAAQPHEQKKITSVSDQTLSSIKDYLKKEAEAGNFSGSVVVAKDGRYLLTQSAGYASKRFKFPNNPETRFNMGSLNKSFTAVAILQLVEAGKLKIDDPIGNYLDFFPKEIASKVTIRQLLDMTNGWGDFWSNEYYLQHKDELREVEQYMAFIKDIPLDFEPGSKMQHSNTGYEVAGAIIEKVSGMNYFDYIREKIYKPAGMSSSDSFDRDGPVDNLATGYTDLHSLDQVNKGWQWENTYLLAPRGTPAGGGYSTVGDMLKYDQAIRAGKLLGKDYVNFMSKGYRGNIGDPFNQQRIPRSAGGAPGISTFYARDHVNGFTIIVLSNLDNPMGFNIGNEIIKILDIE